MSIGFTLLWFCCCLFMSIRGSCLEAARVFEDLGVCSVAAVIYGSGAHLLCNAM